MPNVEIRESEFTELPAVEAVLGFVSIPVSEWDVPRFQHFWAGLDQELPEALRRLQHPIDQILGFRALPPNGTATVVAPSTNARSPAASSC
jgi:hypothetical protein